MPEKVLKSGVPVSIDNDSNLAALGEHGWGAGRGCDDSVTRFGLFVNGTLVRGDLAAGLRGPAQPGHVHARRRDQLLPAARRSRRRARASG